MNTPRDNEKTTADFRLAMLEKLNANNHKKHWSEASLFWLNHRLENEVDELQEAIENLNLSAFDAASTLAVGPCIESAMKECADVADVAMMIWDNLKNGIIEGSSDNDYLEPEKESHSEGG